jgi:hypothetical protein
MHIIGVFLFLLLSLGAAAFFGLFSGMVIVAALLNLRSSRKSEDKARRLTAWICVVIAWIGAGLGFWLWHWFLWDEHFHPGAGGGIPPPSGWDLATVPLVSTGLGVGLLILIIACNALLKWLNSLSSRTLRGRSNI